MSELVQFQKENEIAWVKLNRPEVMNALSFDTLLKMGEILGQIAEDKQIRVVVFTGEGDKAFCAGADLKERVSFTPERTMDYVKTIGDTFLKIARLPQPSIAAINGVAFGGGLELALACDLRIASNTAHMGLTEVSLGIIPGAGGTQRLPRIVGTSKAKELIFTAKRLTAQEAMTLGLLNDVAPPVELLHRAKALANSICANAPLAVRAAKEAIDLFDNSSWRIRYPKERQLYQKWVLPSKDRLEALTAFREKRRPVFKGE